ncbi:coiled-coil domain-containing protein 124-like isoform X1 [Brevipalpus obovatus]|uniref:coiled-coil domain-containing protein 124-like isoform X1 n=1 Tax=Brevipalpus obovatus TaxID=246614 RepID=UPI003D9ED4C5
MPKKMGTNTKAVEARARKEEKKNLEKEQKQKAIDDEYWKDTDKHVMKKEQRKADQEKKKQETLEKKALKQQLYEEEMSSIKSASSSSVGKITRAQISKTLESKPKPSSSSSSNVIKPKEIPLEENINRIQVEGLEARTVDEAISAMKDNDLDRHPERRLKAAYIAFEERMLPRYKIDYPTFRMSQVKHLLRKEWQKSPENPLNQPHSSFNSRS